MRPQLGAVLRDQTCVCVFYVIFFSCPRSLASMILKGAPQLPESIPALFFFGSATRDSAPQSSPCHTSRCQILIPPLPLCGPHPSPTSSLGIHNILNGCGLLIQTWEQGLACSQHLPANYEVFILFNHIFFTKLCFDHCSNRFCQLAARIFATPSQQSLASMSIEEQSRVQGPGYCYSTHQASSGQRASPPIKITATPQKNTNTSYTHPREGETQQTLQRKLKVCLKTMQDLVWA